VTKLMALFAPLCVLLTAAVDSKTPAGVSLARSYLFVFIRVFSYRNNKFLSV